MSDSNSIPILDYGSPPVISQSLWQWDNTGDYPVATGYGLPGNYKPTKTGLLPSDLQAFVGVPLQYYQPCPTPVAPETILQWIRYAEDLTEQQTGLLLCPTWVASPPNLRIGDTKATHVDPSSGEPIQMQGRDYDLADSAYDFFYPRFRDEGWGCTPLRYRPVRNALSPSRILTQKDYTGVKNVSFIYPLLSEFFRLPRSWIVEDQDFGLIRMVPSSDTTLLPLFALQIAMLGFAESLPGGLWLQYTAGLMPNDYNTRFRFIQQLVLSLAAIQALNSIQGTINMGMVSHQTNIDGVAFSANYGVKGPFGYLIDNYQKQADSLMDQVYSKVSGPAFITI